MRESQYQNLRERLLADFWNDGDLSIGSKLPTERELAERYGVSRATVSKATAALAAEGWVTKRQGSGIYIAAMAPTFAPRARIGFVAASLRMTLCHRVFEGVEHVARNGHVSLEVAASNWSLQEEQRQIGLLQDRGVRGVVLYPVARRFGRKEYLADEYRDFPIVVVDQYEPEMNRPHLVFDNFSAGRDMTREVLARGHRTIAFLTLDKDILFRSIDDRLAGYRRALGETGESYVADRVVAFDGMGPLTDSHAAALERILMLDPRPTALITPDDLYAHGTVAWFRARGIEVPKDILVTGFDNLQQEPWEERFPTTEPDFVRIGERAAELLLDRFDQRSDEAPEVVLPCPLLLPEQSRQAVTMVRSNDNVALRHVATGSN